ncbi:MAG: ArsR/SmtB family transcription factor [Candidatus Hodarchaeales archaeon]
MEGDPMSEIELILKIISYTIENKGLASMEEIDEILHLLSNRTRRRMLVELADGESFVNDLVERLNDHPQSITRHLEVLKKHNLITGEERQKVGQRGRPRLYYTLFPDLAEVISSQRSSNKYKKEIFCSSFPRLNAIKNQIQGRISHKEQKKFIEEVENLKYEHEQALELCNKILDELQKKVTKIRVD